MKIHKLAKLFPQITGQEFKDLVADIKANGLRQKIVALDGEILDGVNRHNACIAAKVKPQFIKFKGKNPAAFVISQNLSRRHLNESQRAMIAAEISKCQNSDTTLTQAAKTLNVSRDSAHKAKRILKKSPKLAKKVKAGKISLHAAEKKINPKPLARGGLAADAIRAQRGEIKKPRDYTELLSGIPTQADEVSKSTKPRAAITQAEFQKELDAIEKLIPENADHKGFGIIANKFAERQMNYKVDFKTTSAYTA
jgi:ParB-like chromosome segregation protein Spo0J